MDDEDALYGLPLEQFVPERDELAKRLRKEGDRDAAARVKQLRRPTVAAWAVNQVARSQPKKTRELAAAGKALRDAQSALLGGKGDAAKLRAASERERAAVDDLLEAARGLLSGSGSGLSESTLQDVEDSLHAAAVDDDTRDAVLAGRLDRERKAAGLGGELGVLTGAPARTPSPARRTAKEAKPGKAKAGDKAKAAEEKAAAARADAERREQIQAARAAAREATTAAKHAEREHQLAESRLRVADDALEKAKSARDDARAAERAARRHRDDAAKETKRLRSALERLDGQD